MMPGLLTEGRLNSLIAPSGAAPATPNIDAGHGFTYRFSVPHPGTHWAHPHTGLDADYGLYLPVIVDDPGEPGAYDAEWIVVLDDWTDGIGKTPQQLYDDLTGKGKPSADNTAKKLASAPDDEREALHARLVAEHERIAGGVDRGMAIGVVDEIIDPADTRRRLAEALAAAPAGRGAHGNIPL